MRKHTYKNHDETGENTTNQTNSHFIEALQKPSSERLWRRLGLNLPELVEICWIIWLHTGTMGWRETEFSQ